MWTWEREKKQGLNKWEISGAIWWDEKYLRRIQFEINVYSLHSICKSLCCTPYTYTVLYVNYTSIKLEENKEVMVLHTHKKTKTHEKNSKTRTQFYLCFIYAVCFSNHLVILRLFEEVWNKTLGRLPYMWKERPHLIYPNKLNSVLFSLTVCGSVQFNLTFISC